MKKKVLVLAVLIYLLPIKSLAETVTINTNNVPVQETYNSVRVIGLLSNGNVVNKISQIGELYGIRGVEIEGWISRANTFEGVNEINQSNSVVTQGGQQAQPSYANLTFAQIAADRKAYYRDNGYSYNQVGCIVPGNYKKSRSVDCSSFVSDVIYHYAKSRDWSALMKLGRKTSHYFNDVGLALTQNNKSDFFTLVPSPQYAQPGDILVYDGHVEIYAGGTENNKPKVYNCGGDTAIHSDSVITVSHYTAVDYILRVK